MRLPTSSRAVGHGLPAWRWLLLGLCLALLVTLPAPLARAEEPVTRAMPESMEQVRLSFAPVVREAAPAVVNVFTRRSLRPRGGPALFDDPFFKRFFGENFGRRGPEREERPQALGSGVILSAEGFVVTNHHVIEGADEITVVLADRREFDAEVVLEDEGTDLAVLKVEPTGEALPVLELGDSSDIEVGDIVLAIGNPFGIGQTVTSGIVSAPPRTQAGISEYSFFIQTDAAINPGNSGGALVTLDGRLVGINTAIFSRTGGSHGIGFAIPANMVRTVLAALESGGRIERPWAGFKGQTVTRDLAEGFGLVRSGGVAVTEVYPEGPAALAGLEPGDIVVQLGEQPITDQEALRFHLATEEPGSSVELMLFRDGEARRHALPVTLPPEDPPRDERILNGRHPLAGASVANLSPALAEEMDLRDEWQGVVVREVVRRSPAGRLGFRTRDILVAVNGVTVGRIEHLEEALLSERGEWEITVKRRGRVRTVRFSG